jgi:hypothetical protein
MIDAEPLDKDMASVNLPSLISFDLVPALMFGIHDSSIRIPHSQPHPP